MTTFQDFWSKLLRAFGMRRVGVHWVEPGNAITRAIAEGASVATMASWEEPAPEVAPAAASPIQSRPSADAAQAEEPAPARKGVAA